MVMPETMVIERGCAGERPFALSRTVTLNEKGLPAEVAGVPLITPVETFNVNPGGNEPRSSPSCRRAEFRR